MRWRHRRPRPAGPARAMRRARPWAALAVMAMVLRDRGRHPRRLRRRGHTAVHHHPTTSKPETLGVGRGHRGDAAYRTCGPIW